MAKLKPKRPEMDLSATARSEVKKMLDRHSDEMRLILDKELFQFRTMVRSQLEAHNQAFKEMRDRFQAWEETLLLTYHNIKKNQFLYSHYPDEWVKKYSDIKQGLRDENEAMDERKLIA